MRWNRDGRVRSNHSLQTYVDRIPFELLVDKASSDFQGARPGSIEGHVATYYD